MMKNVQEAWKSWLYGRMEFFQAFREFGFRDLGGFRRIANLCANARKNLPENYIWKKKKHVITITQFWKSKALKVQEAELIKSKITWGEGEKRLSVKINKFS